MTIIGQQPAILLDPDSTDPEIVDELSHDADGITNPNLHRRVDVSATPLEGELAPREYSLGVYGVNSYRTTTIFIHDEDSDDSEVP